MNFKSTFQAIIICLFIGFHLNGHGIIIVNADGNNYLELNKSYVDVTVNNQIAVVKTTQVFLNTWSDTVTGKYAFPLPLNSNPTKLRWRVGRIWSDAIISTNNQNTSVPGNGDGNGQTGTISNEVKEYLGEAPLFFATNDAIPPGKTITVEMTYVQLLPYSYGEVNFEYPNDYSLVSSIPLEEFELSFILESSRSITNVGIEEYNADVTINNTLSSVNYIGTDELPVFDYKISYSLNSDQLGTYSMSTFLDSVPDCDVNLRGFTSMIIEPESNVDAEIIQKNFTLIIDRSGSMQGSKMDQAKQAANFIVNNLNDGDNFNIISFNDRITSFRPSHVPLNETNQNDALDFINNILAINATNISGAIESAIDQFAEIDENKANIIIFFTDGVATSGLIDRSEILESVKNKIEEKATSIFLFTLGIGDDVDKGLLTLLAREYNGLVDFVENEDVLEDITNLFLRINNPVMINTQITFEPQNIIQQIFPNPLPNLYKGEQLILSGRYGESNPVKMTLTGNAFNLPVTYTVNLDLADSERINQSFLPKIWAKQKIDDLSLEYNIAESDTERNIIQKNIDELSVCYGIINVGFNSFVEGVLEFNLLEFNADKTKEGQVKLDWITSMEVNNDKFIVERSSNLQNWKAIGQIDGQGDSAESQYYSFIDEKPLQGPNYYRLKQINFNGQIFYSDIRVATIDIPDQFIVFPNPLNRNSTLFVQWDRSESITVEIYNIVGQKVFTLNNFTGNELDLPRLDKGIYLCNFIKENSTTTTRLNIN